MREIIARSIGLDPRTKRPRAVNNDRASAA
jgi:hypothetical protein